MSEFTYAPTLIADLTSLQPFLSSALMRLYINDMDPSAASIVSDFEEPTYLAYSGQVLGTFDTPSSSSPLVAEMLSLSVFSFVFDATTGPINIYGFFITDASGTLLLYAKRLEDAPIHFTNSGDFVDIQLRVEAHDVHG